MHSTDDQLIRRIVLSTNQYLDRVQRQKLLWAELDDHISISHIAEDLGEVPLVSVHLQAVTRLLAEILEK